MIKAFKKIKEVGYYDLDIVTNRYVINRGLLLGQVGFYGQQESLMLDAKTNEIERVPKNSIVKGRTLRKLEEVLAKCPEDDEENETEEADKLEAWKRLKAKGFEFKGWHYDINPISNGKLNIVIGASLNDDDSVKLLDLNLLFGGKE